VKSLLFAAAASALAVFGANAASAGFQRITIAHAADEHIQQGAGVAVGPDGSVHVTWRDGRHRLHYTHITGSKKVDQIIDTEDAGDPSAVAVDSLGHPHVAYHAVRTVPSLQDELVYATFDGTAWQTEDLEVGGRAVAIAVDAGDHPHIVHDRVLGPLSFQFAYLHREGSDWTIETPDITLPWPDVPMTLAIDGAGHAHLGMQTYSTRHPAYATNASGAWQAEEVFDGFAATTSLALDSADHPHLAVAETEAGTVDYLSFDGESWSSEQIFDPNDLVGAHSEPWGAALALDADDRPHILFQDILSDANNIDNQTNLVVQAFHNGFEWRATTLSARGERWTRIGIDPNGATVGVWGEFGGGFETQTLKAARIGLPDLSGAWTSLALSTQNGKARVDGVLTVTNGGAGASPSTPIAFYLSDDDVFDAGDQLLSVRKTTGAVAVGKPKAIKVSFTSTLALAGKHLIAVIDPGSVIAELDVTNNTAAGLLGN
jgi:CARDB protein